MPILKTIANILAKLNCKCRSRCCDCNVDITPAEYEEIIKAAYEMVNRHHEVLDVAQIMS